MVKKQSTSDLTHVII